MGTEGLSSPILDAWLDNGSHGMARAAVILNVEPNTLRVGGREFRVKRNPVASGGAFVYDPHDVFFGVTRNHHGLRAAT